MYPSKIYRLSLFEEAAGLLHELLVEPEMLIASVGKIHLMLPQEMESSLRPLIGQRIAILHTDIPEKSYIFQVLADEPTNEATMMIRGNRS